MNRVVRTALQKYIRAGNLKIKTARGATYALGNGRGQPVALRFTTAAAERAKRIARRIRTGQVEINGGAFNPLAPFGGYKQSGYGREHGPESLDAYTQVKTVWLELDR